MARFEPLRRPDDFRRVVRGGQVTRQGSVTVHALARDDDAVRLGLAIRASGAVVRNRVKRRLRAALASTEVQGWDLFARADARAAEVDFQELVNVMERATRTGR